MAARTHVPPNSPTTSQDPKSAARDAAAELFGDPVLGAGFDRIVSTLFRIDPFADYALANASIEAVGGDITEIITGLDKAQTAARAAHRLLVNAQLAYEQAKGEIATIESALRERARVSLEEAKEPEEEGSAKAKGARRKTITNDDVEAEMVRRFPEDMNANRTRRAKAKGTVDHLEALADLAKSRIRTLEVLVGAARR